jgi:hypothetical protein
MNLQAARHIQIQDNYFDGKLHPLLLVMEFKLSLCSLGAWNKVRRSSCGTHSVFNSACREKVSPYYLIRRHRWKEYTGGNGYLRGSRVWDSLYYNNTLRNLRHITMQWCGTFSLLFSASMLY